MALSLVLCLAAAASTRADDRPPLVEPAGNGLGPAAVHATDARATFGGQMLVHGVLVAQWVPGTDKAQVHLLPDPASAKLIPGFRGHAVTHIALTNGLAALRMVSGRTISADFARRKHPMVRAEGIFTLERLTVGIACRAGWAQAEVAEADPIQVLSTEGTPSPIGC